MDWVSVWKDIVGGLLIAGALAAWVPTQANVTHTISRWVALNSRGC